MAVSNQILLVVSILEGKACYDCKNQFEFNTTAYFEEYIGD